MDNTENSTVEYTLSAGRANLIALFLIIPILALTLLPFSLIWDFELAKAGYKILLRYFWVILLGGVVVHESLHGIGWAIFAKSGFRSIRFGIIWKYITPYCHCKDPLKVKHYMVGGALPLVAMGIIPSIVALMVGNGFLICFGILFIWAAGGDIIMLHMMNRLPLNTIVADHPDKLGFYIVNEHNN